MKSAKTDEQFLERIKDIAPEVLEAEVDFDEKIIRALPSKQSRGKPVVTIKKPSRTKPKKKP